MLLKNKLLNINKKSENCLKVLINKKLLTMKLKLKKHFYYNSKISYIELKMIIPKILIIYSFIIYKVILLQRNNI